MWVFGIDVSNWQGVIDWDQVNKSWLSYVYLLTSDGTFRGIAPNAPMSIQAAFERNRQQCKLPRGAYHYARPQTNSPVRSADQVVAEVGAHLELPYMLDLEQYDGFTMSLSQTVDWVGQWLRRVEYLDGRKPVLYCGAFFKGNGVARWFPEYVWMMPSYTANATIDPDPFKIKQPDLNGNRPADIWQFTSKGRVGGINSDVDKSLMVASVYARLIGARDVMSCFFQCQGEAEQDVLVVSVFGLMRVQLPSLLVRQRLVDDGYDDRTVMLSAPDAVAEWKSLPVADWQTYQQLAVPTTVTVDGTAIADSVVAKLSAGFGATVAADTLAALKTLVSKL